MLTRQLNRQKGKKEIVTKLNRKACAKRGGQKEHKESAPKNEV